MFVWVVSFAMVPVAAHDALSEQPTFNEPGCSHQERHVEKPDQSELQIGTDTLSPFHGRVVTPDGRPVQEFVIEAGPGDAPTQSGCEKATAQDADGEFRLELPAEGRHWVGVRAPGFAAWEDWTEVERDSPPFVIRLKRGVRVAGRLSGYSSSLDGLRVELVPHRKKVGIFSAEPASQRFATLTTTPDDDGGFEFANVRPDSYTFSVGGSQITTQRQLLVVKELDVDIGEFALPAPGSVVGSIHRLPEADGGPAPFVKGSIAWPHGDDTQKTRFESDEDGRFNFDNIPSGRLRARIPYCVSSDRCLEYARNIQVQPGATTEVRFSFGGDTRWNLPIDIIVGDGSQAQFLTGTGMGAKRKVRNVTTLTPAFRFEFEPEPGQSVSWPDEWVWNSIESSESNRITLRDVHPGRYRLQIGDWLGTRGFQCTLHSIEVEMREGMDAIRMRLGGGSITGRIRHTRRRYFRVVARSTEDTELQRIARCDGDGDFCVRYLPPGRYTLYAHDYDAGWRNLGSTSVNNDITDVGEHRLIAGASLEVQVKLLNHTALPDTLVAMDQHGVAIEAPDYEILNGQHYSIGNLWPGHWDVVLRSGNETLATARVILPAAGTINCDLVNDSPTD